MKDVVTIPLRSGDDRGLIAYECPHCGHLTSFLIPPPGIAAELRRSNLDEFPKRFVQWSVSSVRGLRAEEGSRVAPTP
jgi:hypothetical protein